MGTLLTSYDIAGLIILAAVFIAVVARVTYHEPFGSVSTRLLIGVVIGAIFIGLVYAGSFCVMTLANDMPKILATLKMK